MAVLTGAHGALKYEGRTVAKCRSWTLTINRDALEDTCIGQDDRTYVKGLRGATGSATILYDPSDANGTALLNSIFNNDASDDVEFVFNSSASGSFKCKALLTTVNPSVNVGDVQAVSVSFQVSGAIEGRY
jgi:hypothetical protein